MSKSIAVRLSDMGLKVTPQRRAIMRYLEGNNAHPSADIIYQALVRVHPNISFATVYNTLSRLVAGGEIQALDIDPGKKRFDPRTDEHWHFYCSACAAIFDVEPGKHDCDLLIANQGMALHGHKVESFHIIYKGVCAHCANLL